MRPISGINVVADVIAFQSPLVAYGSENTDAHRSRTPQARGARRHQEQKSPAMPGFLTNIRFDQFI